MMSAVMGENVEYNNLPEEEKARCRAFVEAWRNMADRNSVEAVEEGCSKDRIWKATGGKQFKDDGG